MAERLEELSVGRVVPSVLTLLGLCSGITAIRFALDANWPAAVAAIIFAMLFDMLDGRAARFLGADTRFGAQLDSLADLVSFGVAPGVLVFMWSLSRMGNAGWIAALIFCACSAIRLARFNVQSVRDEGSSPANPYFTGLPTPAAAGLLLLPMLLEFSTGRRIVPQSRVQRCDDRDCVESDGQPAADAVDQVYAPCPPASLDRVGLRRPPGRLHDHLAMDHAHHRHGDLSDVDPVRDCAASAAEGPLASLTSGVRTSAVSALHQA